MNGAAHRSVGGRTTTVLGGLTGVGATSSGGQVASPTGADPASPWARFQYVLDSRGVAPAGQTAFWNYNRFSDPSVASLLDQAAAASAADQPKLYEQLDNIFRQNIPTIPLEYRPLQFYQYQEKIWGGFPNSSNPYAPPLFRGAGMKWLTKISAKA